MGTCQEHTIQTNILRDIQSAKSDINMALTDTENILKTSWTYKHQDSTSLDSSGCVFSQSLTSNVMTAANVEAIHAQVQNFKIDVC